MVWEGKGVIIGGRTLLGATNPADSAPGTIRGDFSIDVGRNVCHGSDGPEGAAREIAHWFQEGEIVDWGKSDNDWVYE
jgi:nucleoside-diphosphate kinase